MPDAFWSQDFHDDVARVAAGSDGFATQTTHCSYKTSRDGALPSDSRSVQFVRH